MAHDDRSDPRRSGWGRETQWQGDDSFGGGWGNQIARPERGYDPQNVTPQGALFGADARGGEFARPRHDPHYSEWRQRQIDAFDRDYDDYVREHQSRFDREFGAWREERGRQRDAAARVREHMEVVGVRRRPCRHRRQGARRAHHPDPERRQCRRRPSWHPLRLGRDVDDQGHAQL